MTVFVLLLTWFGSLILVAALFYGHGRRDEERYQKMLARERRA